MTEPVIIDVRDKVASSISSKIKAIATDARKAQQNVDLLKASLANVGNATQITRAQIEINKLDDANIKAATSAQKLKTAQEQTALASQRVATEAARTTAAMARAEAAQVRAAQTQERATIRAVQATMKQSQELEALRLKYDPLFAISKQYERALAEIARAERAGVLPARAAAEARERAAQQMEFGAVSSDKYGRALRNMSFEAQNASFQLQDIFVTAEMGQDPIRIALQQGTQLGAVMNQMAVKGGGAKGAIAGLVDGIRQMINPLSLAVLAGTGLAAWGIQWAFSAREAEQGTESLKDVLQTLNEETADATLKIQQLVGGFDSLSQASAAQNVLKLQREIAETQERIANTAPRLRDGVEDILQLQQQQLATLQQEIEERNKAVSTAERLEAVYNDLDAFEEDRKRNLEAETQAREQATISAQALLRQLERQADVQEAVARFGNDSAEASAARAQAEREAFQETLASRNISEELKLELLSAWDNAQGIADTNMEGGILNAAAAARELAAELEVSLGVAFKLASMSAAARSGVSGPDGAVQQVRGSFEDAVVSTQLFEGENRRRQRLESERAARGGGRRSGGGGRGGSSRDVKGVKDYVAELNKELELLKLLPREREIEIDVQKTLERLKKDNVTVTQEEIALIREKTEAVKMANEADQLLQSLPETAEQRVEQMRQMYAHLESLRSQDLISEQQYSQARRDLWVQEQKAKTDVFSDFFGGIAQLASSENEKMARIGKAAAITQTVIKTYQSATEAYAAMAGIPVVGPALGAAAAAAAIAAGAANVASIRSQSTSGFMYGGYTGDGARNEAAGTVHRREFVFDAGATSRIGQADLEALRIGAASVQRPDLDTGAGARVSRAPQAASGGQAGQDISVKIVNVTDPNMLETYLKSENGERVLLNVISENSDDLKTVLQNA